MGMEQKIITTQPISWTQLTALLQEKQVPVEMRMIDGELAFPDEQPPEQWRELRIGTPPGMITLKRDGDTVLTIIWGNADQAMQQAWNAVTWACAQVTEGEVETETGRVSADTYRGSVDLPEGF